MTCTHAEEKHICYMSFCLNMCSLKSDRKLMWRKKSWYTRFLCKNLWTPPTGVGGCTKIGPGLGKSTLVPWASPFYSSVCYCECNWKSKTGSKSQGRSLQQVNPLLLLLQHTLISDPKQKLYINGIHVLVNVPARVFYGNYWVRGSSRRSCSTRHSQVLHDLQELSWAQ